MFEDLVKIAALGYVGSKMSQEMSKRTDERKREQAEAIQQLKNFAFVVYDGKAPYTDEIGRASCRERVWHSV